MIRWVLNNLLVHILFVSFCFGQNLIVDPGFEDLQFNYEGQDTLYEYTHWKSLTIKRKISKFGFPKYSTYKTFLQSERVKDAWKPYDGDSQLVPYVLHKQNLYQTKLLNPLVAGQKYKVSFKYRVIAYYIPKEKVALTINHKIGGRFSIKDYAKNDTIGQSNTTEFKQPPHFKISSYHPDSLYNWVNYVYYFEADWPYAYLTIGNFIPIANSIAEGNHPMKAISFRIDDVSVEPIKITDDQLPKESDLYVPKGDTTSSASSSINFDKGLKIDSIAKAYYQWISKAENTVISAQFDSSYNYYHLAFQLKSPPFKDYRNATNVANKLSKSNQPSFSDSLPQFKNTGKTDEKSSYQIDSIFQLDQLARSNNNNIGLQDSSNYLFLKNLFSTKTLSEETIGFNNMQNLITILLHLSRYPHFNNLLIIMYKDVLKGNFDNRQFASLVDSYYSNIISGDRTKSYYYTASAYPLFTQFVIPELDPNLVKEVNERRQHIGLESLENQYRKQFYNFKHGYKDYEFYQFFSYYPAEEFCSEEEKAKYLEKEKDKVAELKQQYEHLIIWSK